MASNNFIEECKYGANSNRLGKFTIDSVNVNQSEYLNQMSIKESIYNNGNILGGIFDKTLEATLVNKPDTLELEGKTISNVAVGVKYSDSTTEYVSFDNFIVETIKDAETNSSTSITAYGSGTKLDEPYNCTLDFSSTTHTIYEFYEDVCEQLGLTPTDSSITNGTISVSGNPFTNAESCRIVLEAIEKVSCSYVDIDWSNQTISLTWFSDTIDYEFNPSDYSTLEGSLLKYGPVNVVIIGNSQVTGENVTEEDSESITLNGENQIIIDEPYFLYNQQLREQALPAIFDKLDGFEYYDIKLTTPYGKPFLKVGNKIRINTVDNKIYDTYVLTHEFIYNGAFKSIIESPALTKTEQTMKNLINSSSIKNRLRKTEIVVDKINGEITSTVARVETLEESIEALEFVPDTNLVIVNVNGSKKPFSSKTYEVDYDVLFLGTSLSSGYTITSNNTHTGITVNVSILGKLKFTVNSNTAITSEENKFGFTVSYTSAGTTYTSTKYVMVNTLASEVEQNVVIGSAEPTDTSVLWYDTNSDTLKSYIELTDGYALTTDLIFDADNQYYELINDNYVMVTFENNKFILNDGTEYSVGDNIPENMLYNHYQKGGDWTNVNEDTDLENYANSIAKALETTSTKLGNQINTVSSNLSTTQNTLNQLSNTVSENYAELSDLLEEQGTELTKISTIESNVQRLQSDTYDKTQIQKILNGTGYFLTKDTKYQSGTTYFNSSYRQLVAGTDYNVGDTITGTIYEYGLVRTVVNNISQFDDSGLSIKITDDNNNIISDTTGLYNDKGISIHKVENHAEGDEVLYAGYVEDNRFGEKYIGNTIVYTDNLKVNTYAELGSGVLIQDYTDPETNLKGAGWFAL